VKIIQKTLAPQPPSLRRLLAEKFENAEEWFTQEFLPQFNSFATDVSNALQRTVAEERVIEFATNSNVTTADASPWPLIIKPQHMTGFENLTLTRVENLTDASAAGVSSGAVWPWWTKGPNGECIVRFISGLNVDSKYRFRFRLD